MSFSAFIPPRPAETIDRRVFAEVPRPPQTTPAERLGAALAALRWSTGDLAALTGASPRTAWSWPRGGAVIPPVLLTWLEELAAFHRQRPVPAITTGRRGNPNWVPRRSADAPTPLAPR